MSTIKSMLNKSNYLYSEKRIPPENHRRSDVNARTLGTSLHTRAV